MSNAHPERTTTSFSLPQPPSSAAPMRRGKRSSAASAAGDGDAISPYEQQRLARIRENKERLEALGLPALASSLLGSPQSPSPQQKKKQQNKKERALDDEYRPSDDDNAGDDEESSAASSDDEDRQTAASRRRKGKKKNLSATRVGSTSSFRENSREFCNSDDDEALQQAISLSLGVAKENPGTAQSGVSPNSGSNVEGSGSPAKKSKANVKGTVGRMNNKKQGKSRVQLTEDEVVAYFFSFDEAGKGYITLRDLQRMVAVHDFTWTDMEIGHMIHSFDTDGDGQNEVMSRILYVALHPALNPSHSLLCNMDDRGLLSFCSTPGCAHLSLAEFQTIVTRCQMFQRPKEC